MPALKNDRQEALCRLILTGLDAAHAAVEAGYSPKGAAQTAHRILQLPQVIERLAELRGERNERLEIEADKVLAEVLGIAMADIGDVLEWGTEGASDEDGNPMTLPNGEPVQIPFVRPVESRKLTAAQRRAIGEVTMTDKGSFKIKMHDKGAALDKLMKHLGLFEKDNSQAGEAAAGTVAALVAACQGTPLKPTTDHD